MKITEDVRKYAAEQGIAEKGALAKGLSEKAEEFVARGAKVYSNSADGRETLLAALHSLVSPCISIAPAMLDR